jgi:hypothetical protein
LPDGKRSQNWQSAQPAIGRGLLFLIYQSVGLNYMDYWWLTAVIKTEIVNMFNIHPSSGVMTELASAVSTDYARDVPQLFSMYVRTTECCSGEINGSRGTLPQTSLLASQARSKPAVATREQVEQGLTANR